MSSTKQRLLAALLCAVMALGLCIPAGAAPAMLGDDYSVAETPVEDHFHAVEARTSAVERPSVDTRDEQASLLDAGSITIAAGDLESAYVQWTVGSGVTRYDVYVAPQGGSYTKLDDQLIRSYPGYMRADALGLKAGTYTLKVVPDGQEAQAMVTAPLTVIAHERTGFAFVGGTSSGAYNADGTLKSNAVVVYVDNKNFDSVQATIGSASYTGVQDIVYEGGASKGAPGVPVCIRVLGTIDTTGFPKGSWGSSAEGLQIKAANATKNKNLTIEGVGNDAAFDGFGMLIRNCENIEVRNLGFINFADDGVSIDTDNKYLWIHNNDFFYGGPGGDSDQAKGDGSLDVKASHYCSFSYNHFWDSGKCSLLGMHNDQNYITYHHNWFDHSDSRHPRIRIAKSVHVYNNYYDGVAKYGVGAAENSGAFVEANYFRNTKYPMLSSLQGSDIAGGGKGTFSGEPGGIIKAYNNIIVGAKAFVPYDATNAPVEFDAYVAKTRDEKVPATVKAKSGGTTYTNFDTTDDIGVTAAQVESPDQAMLTTTKWAGRVQGGDLQYEFDEATQSWSAGDAIAAGVIADLKAKLTSYKTTLVSVGGKVNGSSSGGSHTHTPGAWQITKAPGCNKDTQELVPGQETQYCTTCGEVLDTRTVPGQHSNDGSGKCANCGYETGNGGGTVVGGNGKALKASDFKMTAPLDAESKKSALTAEELAAVADGYFSMQGEVNKRIPKAGNVGDTVQFFDLSKSGTNGIQFTVSAEGAPASMTASFSSSGSSNTSALVLEKADGTRVATDKGATFTAQKTTTATSVNYKDLAAGTYIIKGSTDGGAASDARLYTVTVSEKESENPSEPVEVTSVGLNKTTANVAVGGTVSLIATVVPTNATNKKVTWESSDETVATVSANGVVTAKKVGTATITVTTVESGFTAACVVTVTSAPIPEKVDKTALDKAIADAAAAKLGVVTSESGGKDVDKTVYWVTTAQLKAFNQSITDAEAVSAKATATQDEVNSATTALTAALTAFNGQKALGTKEAAAGTAYELIIDNVVSGLGSNPPTGWTTTAITLGADPLTNQGTSGIFTLYPKDTGSSGSKFENSKKTFSDGVLNNRYNPGGKVGLNEAGDKIVNAIGFTTTGAATVKVWWIGGNSSESRHMAILDSKGTEIAVSKEGITSKADPTVSTMNLTAAGTYYLGGKENNNNVYKVQVTVSGGETPVVIDKTALNQAIKDAAAAKAGVVTSADGKDVDKTVYWVTAAQLKTLNDAAAAAEAVASAAAPTQAQVDKAAQDLSAAVNTFKGQKALGTKEEGTVTPPDEVKVTGVTIQNGATASVAMGKTLTLTAEVTVTGSGATAADKAVTWSSGNEKVATVKDGVVTPVGVGTAEIVATSVKDATKSAKLNLTVTKGDVTLTVEARNVGIDAAGGAILLRVNGVPAGAQASVTITPTTGGAKVEACDENGWNYKATLPANTSDKDDAAYEVTAAFAGDANWNAATPVKTTVYVRHVGAKVISLTKVPGGGTGKLEFTEGDKLELTVEAKVTPEGELKYEWLKDGKAIAGATAATYTKEKVTFDDAGEYVCRVSCEGAVEGREAKVTVTVKSASGVAVESVSLNKTSTSVTVGRTTTLTATVKPDNATNKSVKWSSSNETVATVNELGTVTGKKAGTATITVTTVDGGKTATCSVTVTASSGGGGGGGGGGGSSSGGSSSGGSSSGGSSGGGATTTPSGLPFVDVAANAWYHDSVKKIYEKGLMKGTDATHFAPDQNTSRAMVATVLYRLDGEKSTDVKALFHDVVSGSWYAKAVEWASAKGVVKGYDENTFAPDDNVTREQLAVMLYRYAAPAGKSTKDLSAFADAASVSDWALEAITWAVDKGIMNGKGNGSLDPQGLASRAEICAMLVRFTELNK